MTRGIAYLLAVFMFAGCASSIKSFKVKKNRNTVAGKFKILRISDNAASKDDVENVTSRCKVCLNSRFNCYKLDDSGKVLISTKKQKVRLRRLVCDPAKWYGLPFEKDFGSNFSMRNIKTGVNYFGEATMAFGKKRSSVNWVDLGLDIVFSAMSGGYYSNSGSSLTRDQTKWWYSSKDKLEDDKVWISKKTEYELPYSKVNLEQKLF